MQWVIPGIALVVILIFGMAYLLNRKTKEVSARGDDDVSDDSADGGGGGGAGGSGDGD
jgi:hypothetical protein